MTLYGRNRGATGAFLMVVLSKTALMEAFKSMELDRTARASEREGRVLLSVGRWPEELVTTIWEST